VDGGASPAQGGPTDGPRIGSGASPRREQTRLLAACQASRNPHLYVVVVLALSTATRKNELLHRQWSESTWHAGCSVSSVQEW